MWARARESAETVDDASSADTGAAFGQDDSEFNVFNTDRQLSALQTAANMLGKLNEKKSLIYFASGMRLNGVDNQAQLHATVDAAIKAGVTFWPVDARGLVAQAPLGDATHGSPGNAGMYTGAAAMAVTNNFQQSQDTLYALAGDTGGKAFLDNNDLDRAESCRRSRPSPTTTCSATTRPIPRRTAGSAASRSRWRRIRRRSSIIARVTTPTRSSTGLPRWTRSASLKMR